MKRIMIQKYLLTGAFLLWTMTVLTAQDDPYAIFQKILDAYQTEELLSYELSYQYGKSRGNITEQEQTLSMQITQKGNNYAIRSTEGDMLYIDEQHLMVNHSDKQMLLRSVDSEKINENNPTQMLGFDLEQIQREGEQEGLKLIHFDVSEKLSGLRFEAPDHAQTVMEFIYNKETSLFDEIHIHVQVNDDFARYIGAMQNTNIHVKYDNYKISKAAFPYSINQYVEGGQVTNAYKNYELVK